MGAEDMFDSVPCITCHSWPQLGPAGKQLECSGLTSSGNNLDASSVVHIGPTHAKVLLTSLGSAAS